MLQNLLLDEPSHGCPLSGPPVSLTCPVGYLVSLPASCPHSKELARSSELFPRENLHDDGVFPLHSRGDEAGGGGEGFFPDVPVRDGLGNKAECVRPFSACRTDRAQRGKKLQFHAAERAPELTAGPAEERLLSRRLGVESGCLHGHSEKERPLEEAFTLLIMLIKSVNKSKQMEEWTLIFLELS